MMEVCKRFGMKINEYRRLPPGDKALYNQYALLELEKEAKPFAVRLTK